MLTNQQLMHEQVRLQDQIHDICQAIETMRAVELEVRQRLEAVEAEQKRRSHGKAGPIAECDESEIVITDDDGEVNRGK